MNVETDGVRYEHAGVVSGSSAGTLVTNASVDTKGSWVQLIASTAFDADGLWVIAHNISTGVDAIVDIGTGASGSERILLPDLMFRGEQSAGPHTGQPAHFIPLSIPAGTRIAARLATDASPGEVRVSVLLVKGGFLAQTALQRVATYGVPSPIAAPYGTLVDPGATVNTKGAWVQFVASVPFDVKGVFVDWMSESGILTAARWSLDVGIGAAASEVVRVPDVGAALQGTTEAFEHGAANFIPVDIPANSRIALRCACSITDASDRLTYAVLHVVG